MLVELTESEIRFIFSESGKMKVKDMMDYLEARYSGRYDKKLARSNAKELCAAMKSYIK